MQKQYSNDEESKAPDQIQQNKEQEDEEMNKNS
jgi:hypothetical protein